MRGQTVVVTGGTSGIGAVAAERLAAKGARIVLIARNEARAKATLDRLRRVSSEAHTACFADLMSIADTKRVAAEIAAAEPRIDVLINNAGAMFADRKETKDGLERTFALNHMAYFVLTTALKDKLVASAPARIVSTASLAHRRGHLDFADLQLARGYSAWTAYANSKLCNILFTRELARRLEGTGVTANCLHPGFVATRFGDEAGGMFERFAWIAKLFAITPEKGADTIVYLASSPDVTGVSGKYFYQRTPIAPTSEGQDDSAARKLWDVSAGIAGLTI